ncbi:hypothetical protein GGR43_003922 [Sphingobium jiangsuense]|uniref:Lipoprotein n=1 Tax=Sphingobium jiangsuense TaxID=870476 RepID=A0A7W6BQH9_9SPHN|nr:hypothetical protein [Sphingobium jiangsuense]MBB3928180.1 hypothetical protein [Sphingobium jiangsuense]
MIFRTMLPIAALLLSGCVAKTAWNVATVPVRAGSQAADWATTSQDEADRNRGREMRKEEERQRKACRKQGRKDC